MSYSFARFFYTKPSKTTRQKELKELREHINGKNIMTDTQLKQVIDRYALHILASQYGINPEWIKLKAKESGRTLTAELMAEVNKEK